MNGNKHGASRLGVFLLGGMVGVVLGVLFAPQAGKNTRDAIANRRLEYFDVAKESCETNRERLVEVSTTASEGTAEKAEEL